MPKYFMGGTKFAAFERMMMETPKPQRHSKQREKPKPREKKGIPFLKEGRCEETTEERSV